MLGGFSKMREAGCAVIGGHSIADDEIKFGYAVTGTIDPTRVLANSAARAETCFDSHQAARYRRDLDRHQGAEEAEARSIQAAVESMTMLNRSAARA